MVPTYVPIDGAKLSSILAGLPEVSAKLGGAPAEWRVREVGDGNLNLVFIVEGPAGGLVVKQALPYGQLVGKSWPLPLERSWFEYNALVEQAHYAPRFAPKVFHFDRAQAMIVMNIFSPHIIMRKGLIRGIEYPHFAADIAEFLAATLFNTSVLAGAASAHKRRLELFARNIELCRITEDLIFTDPYRVATLNRRTSPHLDAEQARLRGRFCAQSRRAGPQVSILDRRAGTHPWRSAYRFDHAHYPAKPASSIQLEAEFLKGLSKFSKLSTADFLCFQ